jgi:replication-associated recombination protein RarA
VLPRPSSFSTLDVEKAGDEVTDLFEARQPAAPLAELMRPQNLDEVVGQRHLLGPGKPLRVAY